LFYLHKRDVPLIGATARPKAGGLARLPQKSALQAGLCPLALALLSIYSLC